MQTAVLRSLRPIISGLASLASLGVALSCGWLATMELFLRRPDYGWRFLIEAAVVVESAVTLAVLEDLAPSALRWPLVAGAVATGLLGWWVIAEDLSRPGLPARPHFEGYLLIVGLALIAYGVLTIVAMLTVAPPRSLRASA
ncbi:MAG: hypothetical protein HY047_09545, partial [Acidobacteria bacterium]|nr:hypothetical protein [Acidobacteriota bacterium]